MGKDHAFAGSPFQAVHLLEKFLGKIDAVLLPLGYEDAFFANAFFDFLLHRYPAIRRVAYASQVAGTAIDSFRESRHEMVIWLPIERDAHVERLRSATSPARAENMSTWADGTLLEHENGLSVEAIAEVVQRYDARIAALVGLSCANGHDRAAIRSQVCLNIARVAPFYERSFSASYFIDLTVRRTIGDRTYFDLRRVDQRPAKRKDRSSATSDASAVQGALSAQPFRSVARS